MTIAEIVGWVLVHFIWQGAAIALALGALLALTSTAHATLRYILSCAALALMLAATFATAATLSIDSQPPAPVSALSAPATSSSPPAPERAASGQASAAIDAGGVAPLASPRWRERLAGRVGPIVERSVPWLVLVWVAGVAVMSIRLAGGWWRTHALRVDGVSAAPVWAQDTLAKLRTKLRITRAVGLVASARVSVPIVLGHLKPVIVIPAASFAGLDPSHLEAILAHELAHVRRHDYLVNLVQSVTETLLFYHPAVWWVSYQVRVAREHCCDDLAVQVCGSRRGYVHALLHLEELRNPHGALALGATDGSLLGRARRLLRHAESRSDAPRLAATAIVLSVVSVVAVPSFFSIDRVDAALVPAHSAEAAVGPEAMRQPASTPQEGQATPVATAPDPGATLASRWAWAERAARDARRTRYWVGYRISPVQGLPRFVYFDRAGRVLGNGISFGGRMFSDDLGSLRYPGRRLAVPAGDDGLKVLFGLDAGRGTPTLTAVHVSTLSLPVDLQNHPVFWLGAAESSQSLEVVDKLYARAGSADLKDDLVAAAGVHDASPAVVAWLSARVESGDPDEVRGNAAEWIARHPIRESIGILDRIARGDRASSVRQEAAEAMGDLALPEAAPALVALARSLPDEDARREAVEALGARSEPIAHEALGTIARQDSSTDIQREAVETLGDYEDRRGVPLLVELARTHPDVDVRREAIETLGDAMPRETLVPLLKELAAADADAGVQEEVVDTLAAIEHPEGLEAVKQLARSHARMDVRREAVEALALRASESADAGERAGILELLSTIASTDRDAEVQAEAVETLGEIDDPQAAERLRELARSHPDAGVRVEAVKTLGEARPPAGSVSLLKSLALSDRSEDVQREAIETLGDLPDGAGIDALVDVAREHSSAELRKEALKTLLESEHPKAREVFNRALGSPPRR